MPRKVRRAIKRRTGRRRIFTSTIAEDVSAMIVLLPNNRLLYKIEGFLEGEYHDSSRKDVSRISVLTCNIRAALVNAVEGVPNQLHLRLKPYSAPKVRLARSSGRGIVELPLQISYPELDLDAGERLQSAPDVIRYSLPLETKLVAVIEHRHRLGDFVASCLGTLPLFTPLSSTAVPCALYCFARCARGGRCLEVCINVKVPSYNGTPLITQQDVQRCVDDANASFGCGAQGQCCIRFRLDPIALLSNPDVPRTVGGADLDALRARKRDPDCYDIYFVDTIDPSEKAFGLTYTSGDNTTSIVQVSGRTLAEYSSTFRHELGHALGLAPNKRDDPRGVDGHSPRPDNVMTPSSNPAPDEDRTRLNQYQCEVVRGSSLVTSTRGDCVGHPREF
jgi:hypothetical protein